LKGEKDGWETANTAGFYLTEPRTGAKPEATKPTKKSLITLRLIRCSTDNKTVSQETVSPGRCANVLSDTPKPGDLVISSGDEKAVKRPRKGDDQKRMGPRSKRAKGRMSRVSVFSEG